MDDKRVSKLISYWLRHAPEDARLTLNSHGWTATADLLAALRARGITTNVRGLQDLSARSDKVRWEFAEENRLIRATHGHSIEVALDQAKRKTPPATLYHGTPIAAFPSILQEGLRPMGRQAVHLATTPAAAIAVGRRRGKAVLLEIDAEAMDGEGVPFYQTSEGVWLTASVPLDYLAPTPWAFITERSAPSIYSIELEKELAASHLLFQKKESLTAVGLHSSSPDVLFKDRSTEEFFAIHLTWKRSIEADPAWPAFKHYATFKDWIISRLIPDQAEHFF